VLRYLPSFKYKSFKDVKSEIGISAPKTLPFTPAGTQLVGDPSQSFALESAYHLFALATASILIGLSIGKLKFAELLFCQYVKPSPTGAKKLLFHLTLAKSSCNTVCLVGSSMSVTSTIFLPNLTKTLVISFNKDVKKYVFSIPLNCLL
jgi:hypothetical protein